MRADARASGRRTGASRRARAPASGSWVQAQAGGRALGARRGAGRAAGRWARGRALGARQAGAGRWARGRQALGARQAGAGRAGRTRPGLALGSALGALGPFSICFDSFFFLSHQMNTVHCKIIFFQKKKNLLNSNKIK